jgi:DNA-binding response OmpR family regulator
MPSFRVYIAEADKVLQRDLATALEANGYGVETFDRGYPVAALMDNWPDLFLIDIELPDINGIELCAWLKSHKSSKSIPIVLISQESYLTVLAASSEADGFLETPFNVANLITTINGCLEGIGSVDQA